MSDQKDQSSKNRPTHDAFTIEEGRRGEDDKFHKFAAGFAHKDGKGHTFVGAPVTLINGRFMVRERKAQLDNLKSGAAPEQQKTTEQERS